MNNEVDMDVTLQDVLQNYLSCFTTR